jgi:hypothetical protein
MIMSPELNWPRIGFIAGVWLIDVLMLVMLKDVSDKNDLHRKFT